MKIAGSNETGALRAALLAAILCLVIAIAYSSVGSHQFVDFDDGEYIYQNEHVLAGLSAESIRWAFSTTHAANWHPLTWLSHMVDVELFGLDARGHHLSSVAFHLLNATLLFLFLLQLTRSAWCSAAVAMLWGVHPLNVENVAWVAERKSLLCTLFGLLAAAAYVGWTRTKDLRLGAASFVAFALSLMSKPMFVTLPALLLVLDFWPLARLHPSAPDRFAQFTTLVREKLPLFALSAASALITWFSQRGAGAAASSEAFPIAERLLNAATSAIWYVSKAFWPSPLAMYYPHPSSMQQLVPRAEAVGALFLIAIITAASVKFARRQPHLTAGWAWFIIAMLPMIGIIQVGAQARADRYAYIPLIGILIAVVWSVRSLVQHEPRFRSLAWVVASLSIAGLATAAHRQASVWRDGGTLYTHALRVDAHNWVAWNNLGMWHFGNRELPAALRAFHEAARINPGCGNAVYNSGVALSEMQRYGEAVPYYERALALEPDNVDAMVNLGIALLQTRRYEEALGAYTGALQRRPHDRFALYGASLLHAMRGDAALATACYRRLLKIDPALAADVARTGLLSR